MATRPEGGVLPRAWRRLRSPSARWSVLALLIFGFLAGFAVTAGTSAMVAMTGTDTFCGGACHSMQWVANEHRASVHGVNRTGVSATCHDCHIPRRYPELLWYKAKAGIKDVIAEARGVISTEEAFKKERLRLATHVWEEFKENNSRNCRMCHRFSPDVIAKQKDFVRPMHEQAVQGAATCIDCHKGVAHDAPAE